MLWSSKIYTLLHLKACIIRLKTIIPLLTRNVCCDRHRIWSTLIMAGGFPSDLSILDITTRLHNFICNNKETTILYGFLLQNGREQKKISAI